MTLPEIFRTVVLDSNALRSPQIIIVNLNHCALCRIFALQLQLKSGFLNDRICKITHVLFVLILSKQKLKI